MKDATLPILQARDLRVVRGGNTILDIPSLDLMKGEVCSLIGPNGAGKTTLMQALAFLSRPTAGKILFMGEVISVSQSPLDYRRKIAMVFQEPLLFDATVYGNVASGLKFRNTSRSKIRDVVERQLNRFGISHLTNRSARTLSGGEAQRTSLARAFATEPEVLFLDEPFASLDPPTRESLTEDLETALRHTATTAVLATHDRMEALRLSDRIGMMNNGRMIQIGTPEDVMNRPADEFVAAFVGAETILSGRVQESNGSTFSVAVADTKIQAVGDVLPGDQVILCIRPENITLSATPENTSARNQFRGKIERIIPAGFFDKIQLDCGFPLTAFITHLALDELSLQENKEVYASFKATAIHVIKKK
jgi:tungstate transport system ATP-binding protein